MITDFCTGTTNFKGSDYFEDTISKIDDSTGKWTSSLMCTDVCPCPMNTDFTKWTESELNSWNRTNSPVTAVLNSNYKILNKTASVNYATFYDCYKYILKQKDSKNYTNNANVQKVEELSDDFVNLLRILEDELNCNGICEPGLFWFLKPVSDGPPDRNCIEGLRDMFKDNTTNIGIALIISCFFTFCAFIVQYGLWRKSKSD